MRTFEPPSRLSQRKVMSAIETCRICRQPALGGTGPRLLSSPYDSSLAFCGLGALDIGLPVFLVVLVILGDRMVWSIRKRFNPLRRGVRPARLQSATTVNSTCPINRSESHPSSWARDILFAPPLVQEAADTRPAHSGNPQGRSLAIHSGMTKARSPCPRSNSRCKHSRALRDGDPAHRTAGRRRPGNHHMRIRPCPG